MPPHPLTNFVIQSIIKRNPIFNCFYSRNSLPKIKDGEYDLDENRSIVTY